MSNLKGNRILSRLKVPGRSIPLIVGLVIAIGLLAIEPVSARNGWAVQYMRHALNARFVRPDPAALPAEFSRAKLWLAREAVSLGDSQEALALVEPQASRGDPYALRIKAAALELQGGFHAALQILASVKDYPLLNDLGDRAAHAGDYTDALAAYKAAFDINSENGVQSLAFCLGNDLNDYASAENLLKNALNTYPNSRYRPNWYHLLGEDLIAQQQFGEAERVFHSALAENPADWASYIDLGWIAQKRDNNVQEAAHEFQQAINLDKSRGDGYYAMAQLLTIEKRFDEADSWYGLAIDRSQDNKSWYLGRANNARLGNHLARALTLYQEIVKRYPDFAAAYYEMAWAYRLDKKPVQAEQSMEKAISLMNSPQDSYWVRAGQIYEWSGDADRALQAYQKALAINPDNAAARAGFQRLTNKK